ncbi:MAG: AraC family transcriptional regulator [Rhodocyclales bacterium]|nr:AraC family transcriptional regulator [Rhodocyclales bacterium]
MNPTGNTAGKALWFIESHFAGEITLDDIATTLTVSRFQLSRAFEAAMGVPVMRYVRARRLSAAARSLSQGAPDILAIALDAGYGSHEAFTRAFREQFGTTPEAIRAQGHLNDIELMEPIKMDETFVDVEPPRFESGRLLLIAGLRERYDCTSSAGIPAQWQRFMPQFETGMAGQISRVAYGVTCNFDDAGNFDYLCGVEVADFSSLPASLSRVRIAGQRYAVFQLSDHISTIRRSLNTIWNKWLPESGLEAADAPNFERYDESFDPRTGMGGMEFWLPIKA